MNVLCFCVGFVIGLDVWSSICEYFGTAEGLTVDCNVTCGNVGFLGLGVVRFGCIGEIICCVVVVTVSTTSSFEECDGV